VIRLAVELPGGRSYPVLVGPGAIGELASVVPPGARRVAVVTQASVPVEVDPGVEHRVFRIGDGETAKSLSTVEELCSAFAGWGLTRADVVVGVGGGVVTDVAGFAAASYHRGLPVVHVATTLLAQIDAAIGGKTGVNLPEGKNLVGAFWQPAAVLCDTTVLETLPEREMACGLGEMAKYHFLGGDDLGGGDLGGGGTAADDGPGLTLEQRVARCVQIKAEVVAADEREAGRRAVLNYGHTLGHALETTGRYDLRHGEAVAIGLVYAAELARSLGRIDDERVAEHRRVVDGYGLSGSLPAGADPDELMAAMGRDKKAIDGLTFVLDGPDGVEVVSGIDAGVVRSTIGAVR
jgi:5-deoxy-5-amino-3-dehydroquinate synthase|tara:strand:- start:8030 stop:9079 length:1050 start_codon:yes stop_codon:yes gene_type:complete